MRSPYFLRFLDIFWKGKLREIQKKLSKNGGSQGGNSCWGGKRGELCWWGKEEVEQLSWPNKKSPQKKSDKNKQKQQ